jgi:hypothetical protein
MGTRITAPARAELEAAQKVVAQALLAGLQQSGIDLAKLQRATLHELVDSVCGTEIIDACVNTLQAHGY